MKISTLFMVFAIISVFFGLLLLITPGTVMRLLGVTSLDELSVMLLRFIGGVALSLGLLSWSLRDTEPSRARAANVLGLSLGNAISGIIFIWGALSGMFNALIWVIAAIFILFAIAFFFASRARPTAA